VAVLLDTHAFLWWCDDAPDLSRKARKAISQEECRLSLVSLWEIAIKLSLGKLNLPSNFERYIPEQMATNGFSPLDLGFRHIAGCISLPWHHRDPFDRLLISQAIQEKLTVVTRDEVFEQYSVRRIW
jgi:PIN domain nuclease of toxin-antitoxin system